MQATAQNRSICIPYRPCFQEITGNLTTAIVLQQLEYWSSRYCAGFYKFLSIPAKPHPSYRSNDSWTEELQISAKVFRRAFDKIGVRHRCKGDYLAAENPFLNAEGKEMYFCSYYDKPSHMTYYFRNHPLTGAMMAECSPESVGVKSEQTKRPLGNGQKGGSTISTKIKAKEYNNESPENLPSDIEPPAVQPSEKSIEQPPETPALANNDPLFSGVNFNAREIFAAKKILEVITAEKQREVLLVLQCMQKKSAIKNNIGYLQAVVKSVQDGTFSPVTPAKKVLTPEEISQKKKADKIAEAQREKIALQQYLQQQAAYQKVQAQPKENTEAKTRGTCPLRGLLHKMRG